MPTANAAQAPGPAPRRPLLRRLTVALLAACVVAAALAATFQMSTRGSTSVTIDGIEYPDPLTKNSGSRVTGVTDWESTRRAELLSLFSEHVYGRSLPKSTAQRHSVTTTQFPGVSRRVVQITVEGPYGSHAFPVRIFIPQGHSSPRPVFLLLDHRGTSTDDPLQDPEFLPVARLTAAGYAVAAFHTADVAEDSASLYRRKVIDLFHAAGTDLPANAGRTISAWAWSASRVVDYLQTDPAIDRHRIVVVGHSRGGKAALWAGAQDERFAGVITNDSGSTGSRMARRLRGDDGKAEDVQRINTRFPHWFAENYRNYNSAESSLPVDQHELIALTAPRRVYVASASEDSNADPKGEFLGLIGALPVYRLYGLETASLSASSWRPALNTAFHTRNAGYHIREGSHGLTYSDWDMYVRFADRSLPDRSLPRQRPFLDRPVKLPGERLEAEHYDVGGSGAAYSDSTATQLGDASFRPGDAVDVQATVDTGGGRNVAYVAAGEWLEYGVRLRAGRYDIRVRMASPQDDRRLRVRVASSPEATAFTTLGTATLTSGSGWQAWRTVTVRGVTVGGGDHRTLRLEAVDGSFNLNWLEFKAVA